MGVISCPSRCKVETDFGETMVYQVFVCDNEIIENEIIVCPICNRILYMPKEKKREVLYDDILREEGLFD